MTGFIGAAVLLLIIVIVVVVVTGKSIPAPWDKVAYAVIIVLFILGVVLALWPGILGRY